MRNIWISFSIAAILFALVYSVSARVCILGTEPDEAAGGRVRFVLPPGDPCSCTKVKLGGHNPYAPPRKDKPVYIDTLPTDAEQLRRLLGCEETNSQANEDMFLATSSTFSGIQTNYSDCQEAVSAGHSASGVYTIRRGEQTMKVYCDMDSTGDQGFIVIQRRIDGTVDFDRSWEEYKEGFGDLEGEFWWGNEKLRSLTETWELVVTLMDFHDVIAQVRYGTFSVTGEKYDLLVGDYEAIDKDVVDAGDGLAPHCMPFTTRDRDNDEEAQENCAAKFGGGWWFKSCQNIDSNLNGEYKTQESVPEFEGIQWVKWQGNKIASLKGCEMKIRRV